MTKDKYLSTYEILYKIFSKKTYSSIALNDYFKNVDKKDKPFITQVTYGVIENNINLEYIIEKSVPKKPDNKCYVLLKMGTYMLKYMDKDNFAIVNEMVNLTKKVKPQLAGFINACLREIAQKEVEYPNKKSKYLTYKYSYQPYFVGLMVKQYGEELTEKMFAYKKPTDNEVRISKNAPFYDDIEGFFEKNKIKYEKTHLKNVFKINVNDLKKLDSSYYTNQMQGSVLIADSLDVKENSSVLDVCSAPGGKSIYIREKHKNLKVVACDVLENRVNLIKKYAKRMKQDVEALVQDATILNSDFVENFDYVLCDVPCSGYGVVYTKPEIKYNRTYEDILSLNEIQAKILDNSSNYVKKGGVLVYSTCSCLEKENQEIVKNFLEKHKDFELTEIKLPFKNYMTIDKMVQFVPCYDDVDAFFVARMERKWERIF